jgi:hypothetical protein
MFDVELPLFHTQKLKHRRGAHRSFHRPAAGFLADSRSGSIVGAPGLFHFLNQSVAIAGHPPDERVHKFRRRPCLACGEPIVTRDARQCPHIRGRDSPPRFAIHSGHLLSAMLGNLSFMPRRSACSTGAPPDLLQRLQLFCETDRRPFRVGPTSPVCDRRYPIKGHAPRCMNRDVLLAHLKHVKRAGLEHENRHEQE